MRDVLIAALPVLGAALPSFLLYRQNKLAGEREARDRAEERAAEGRRQENELAREKLRLQSTGQELAAERRRERYARFLRSAQQVALTAENHPRTGIVLSLSPDEAAEMAASYEDLLLDASPQLGLLLAEVREEVGGVLEAAPGEELPGAVQSLRHAIDRCREQVRRELAKRAA